MKHGDPVLVLFPEGVIGPEREPEPGWYVRPAAGSKHFVSTPGSGAAGWWVTMDRIKPDPTRKRKKGRKK